MNRTERGRLLRTLETYLNSNSDDELVSVYKEVVKDCNYCQKYFKCDTHDKSNCKIKYILGDN